MFALLKKLSDIYGSKICLIKRMALNCVYNYLCQLHLSIMFEFVDPRRNRLGEKFKSYVTKIQKHIQVCTLL